MDELRKKLEERLATDEEHLKHLDEEAEQHESKTGALEKALDRALSEVSGSRALLKTQAMQKKWLEAELADKFQKQEQKMAELSKELSALKGKAAEVSKGVVAPASPQTGE